MPFPFQALYLPLAMAIALVAWWRARSLGGAFLRWSGVLVLAALAVELWALMLRWRWGHNTWLYNVFTPIEFLLMLRLAACHLPRHRIALLVSAAVGLAGMALAFVRASSTDILLVEGVVLMAVIITGWSLAALWNIAQRVDRPLAASPSFWFFLGVLLYFCGIVPFVSMLYLLDHDDPQLTNALYWIVIVLAILRYLLAAFAFGMARRQRQWDEHGRRA